MRRSVNARLSCFERDLYHCNGIFIAVDALLRLNVQCTHFDKAENHVTYFDYFLPVFGQNG